MSKPEDFGNRPFIDSRPDLKENLAPTMQASSMPPLTAGETGPAKVNRGELPPEGKPGPSGAHPWKPKGRKS